MRSPPSPVDDKEGYTDTKTRADTDRRTSVDSGSRRTPKTGVRGGFSLSEGFRPRQTTTPSRTVPNRFLREKDYQGFQKMMSLSDLVGVWWRSNGGPVSRTGNRDQ